MRFVIDAWLRLDGDDGPVEHRRVYVPALRDVLAGRVVGVGDEQFTSVANYTLHDFVRAACAGKAFAVEMLHASDSMLVETSGVWRDLVANRTRFWSSALLSVVQQERAAARRRPRCGTRIEELQRLIDFLSSIKGKIQFADVWSTLPSNAYMTKERTADGERFYVVCKRKIPATAVVGYYVPVLQQIVKSYVEPGSQHDGVEAVDWLAVARLLRRTYQVMYIYRDGGFAYPLTDEPYLSEVRRGQHAYDVVMNNVSRMIQQLPVLAKRALHVPKTCDVEWWNDWLYRTMLREPMPKPGTNEAGAKRCA